MRRPARGKAGRKIVRAPKTELTLAGMLDYAAMMEEPLELALDLTRGFALAAHGLGYRDDGRALYALSRAANGALHQVKAMLATLMKARAEIS